MSYNGVGLQTARGSATSGHVSKNASYIKPSFVREKVNGGQGQRSVRRAHPHRTQQVNPEIMEHNFKRQIEVELMELRVQLEDGGLSEAAIELRIQKEREIMLDKAAARGGFGSEKQHALISSSSSSSSRGGKKRTQGQMEEEEERERVRTPMKKAVLLHGVDGVKLTPESLQCRAQLSQQ